MKPANHPEFFRMAAPDGTSRESTLRLDAEGRFWHDGELVEHPSLSAALHSWIALHPDNGRFILTNGYDWTYFQVDDAPYQVRSLRGEGNSLILRLSDGSEETLDPSTLTVGASDALYAKVKSGKLEARFSRHAQLALAPWVQVDDAERARIVLGERDYPVFPRIAAAGAASVVSRARS